MENTVIFLVFFVMGALVGALITLNIMKRPKK